jgi:hypothetical protein
MDAKREARGRMGQQRGNMKEKMVRPDRNLLQLVTNEVHHQLDVELLRIDECLAVMPALMRAKERGVRVRISLPLVDDPGFPGRAWNLESYLARGIEIRWCTSIRKRRLIADGQQAYRLDAGESRVQAEPENDTFDSAEGRLEIYSGEVLDKQPWHKSLHGLDRVVFVRIWALGGLFPIFFSSERTPVDALLPGDQIEVLLVINWSGSGLFSAFVPAELYYQGIDVRRIARTVHG